MPSLYILGGPAKVGKSTLTERIQHERHGIRPAPNDLCRPIVRSLFAKDVPDHTETISYKGTLTFGPSGAEETRPFHLSFSVASSHVKAAEDNSLIELPTDYIRSIIRLIFVGENRGLSAIAFTGTTTFIDGSKHEIGTTPIAIGSQGEDANAWNALVGLIDEYDRANRGDVVIEGVAISPDRVHALAVTNLSKRVVFIGYSNAESYVQSRIEYAKTAKDSAVNNYDWPEIQRKGEEMFKKELLSDAQAQVPKNAVLEEQARALGYEYFDIIKRPFDEHIKTAMSYLFAEKSN
jgi:2-phosphoglycerate kinase